MLAALLDYHPECEVGFENFGVAHLLGGELPWNGHDVFGQRTEAFMAGCKKLASESCKPVWGNKITTEQLLGLEEHNDENPDARIDVFDRFSTDVFMA